MTQSLSEIVTQRGIEFSNYRQLEDNIYASKTDLWSGFLASRENFLDPESFEVFRSPDVSGSLGTGDHPETDEKAEAFFKCMVSVLERYAFPKSIITEYEEPALGRPRQFQYESKSVSPTYLRLSVTAWRVAEALKRRGLGDRPVRICEIGAGFGLMSMLLHRFVDVQSYTVIDLPENLYLSSTYAPFNLPGRSVRIIGPGENLTSDNEAALNFLPPPLTDQVQLPFDLVVNIASLGEMPLSVANAYLGWTRDRLTDNGVLYSENRLNVPKRPEARRHSDYDFLDFELLELGPVAGAFRPANQVQLCQVLGKGGSAYRPSPPQYDALTQLCAGGFSGAVRPLCTAMVENSLSFEDQKFLERIWRFFEAKTLEEKLSHLETSEIAERPAFQLPLKFMAFSAFEKYYDSYALKAALVDLQPMDVSLAIRVFGHIAELERGANLPMWTDTLDLLEPYDRTMAERLTADLKDGVKDSRFATRFKELLLPFD